MSAARMADHGDASTRSAARLTVTAWGKPAKTPPGTILPLAGAISPIKLAKLRERVARDWHRRRLAKRTATMSPAPPDACPRASRDRAAPRARESRPAASRASSGRDGPDDDGGSDPPPPRRCALCGTALGEICFSARIGEWTCWRCYQRHAPDEPLGEPLTLEDEGGGERRPRDDGRAPRGALSRAFARAQRRGLRPVLDAELERVLSECPACHAGETDALGIWRPMVVVPRVTATTYRCDACGIEEVRRVG